MNDIRRFVILRAILEENAPKLLSEDLERYKKQHATVTEIIATFEKPGYSDEDTTVDGDRTLNE
jgi:hypothetical protein